MTSNLPKPVGIEDDLVRQIAMDVGKDLVEYIERMYPEMVTACRSWKSARVSLRNHVYNDIMAAVSAADQGRTEKQLAFNDRHRRVMRKLRSAKTVEDVIRARKTP